MRYALTVLLLYLIVTQAYGQNRWNMVADATVHQWLIEQFNEQFHGDDNCPPDLSSVIQSSEIDEALHPFTQNPKIEAECIESLFKNHCERLISLRKLSDLYFPLFHKHLQAQGLDNDFAFLGLIASGLNASYDRFSARSGLWAMDVRSAQMFGLRIDEWVDLRKAADPSTQIAVKILKQYKDEFHGDDLKTIVAFLRGPEYARAFQPEEADAELHFDLCMLHVLIRLFHHTESTPTLSNWLKMLNTLEAIPIQKAFSYRALSVLIDEKEEDLRGMNPAFHGDSIPADFRAVSFVIPKNKIDRYYEIADSLPRYRESLPNPERLQNQASQNNATILYTVKSGDVLGTIATKHRTTVSKIKQLNNLSSDKIRIGQKLKIPGSSNQLNDNPSSTSQPTDVYTVKPGDSLWTIAKKFPGVSAEDIMEFNSIDDGIRPGQKLKIPRVNE